MQKLPYRFTFLLASFTSLLMTVSVHADDHSHHMISTQPYIRSTANYPVPVIHMKKQDGKTSDFLQDIQDDKPVFLNFIYTTCTAVCPVMTHTFATFEHELGPDSKNIHLVSVSIDPEQDTPARLKQYAKEFDAGTEWIFYTGTLEASIAVQKAFAAYRGDKMNHSPLTLIRPAPGKPWIRLDGFATPYDLMHEYQQLMLDRKVSQL